MGNYSLIESHGYIAGGDLMSDRGTNNSPNTRNPKRPPRKPSRLDQFNDDIFEEDKDIDTGVTSRKEKRKWFK